MKNTILGVLILMTHTLVYSQKHDNTWKFGVAVFINGNIENSEAFDVNFQEGNPKVTYTNDNHLAMGDSGFTMSDSSGENILFYTDGLKIKNKNDELITGGEDISEGGSIGVPLYSTVSILKPGSKNTYLLFFFVTNAVTAHFEKLRIVEIDMDKNGGLGEVIKKTTLETYNTNTFVQFTLNKHANGRDWWLLSYDRLSNVVPFIKTYLINTDTIIRYQDQLIEATTDYCSCYRYPNLSFSPDGSILFDKTVGSKINFYNFDRCSGKFTYWKSLIQDINVEVMGGSVISGNNKYFYVANGLKYIYQYELQNDNMEMSKTTVLDDMDANGTQFLQLGPDGRVYSMGNADNIGSTNNPVYKWYIEGINFPSRKGISCGAKVFMLKTGSRNSGYPPYYPNYRLGPIDGSTCDSLGLDNHPLSNWRWDIEDSTNIRQVTFTDNASYEPTTWHWDFGDGTMSQDTSPVHTYAQNGVYYVCMTVCNANSCDTLCRDVYVGVSSIITENVEKNTLSVLPNPAHESVTVSWTTAFDKGQLEVFDIMGRKISTTLLSNDDISYKALETANYASGMYLVRLTCGTDCVYSQKFIVEH
jgi:PKD domain/Secretion system C-terminal sorting domain